MSARNRTIQFGLFLGLITFGCLMLSGCGDDESQSSQTNNNQLVEPVNSAADDNTPDKGHASTVEVADNDPTKMFSGWDSPDDVLVFTGRQYGYVEPCGCTGLDNQKGGLARRHSFLRSLRDRGWNVLAVDTGNQVRRFGRQPELKFNLTSELLQVMEYQTVGIGPDDLKLPAGELFAVAAVDDNAESLFISSNVAILDREFTRRFQILESSNQSIAVATIIADQWLTSVFSDDLQIEKTDEALELVAADEQFQEAAIKVLMVHGPLDFVRSLARTRSEFDLFVCAGAPGEPAYELEEVKGAQSKILKVGEKSMFASVVGIFADAQGKISFKYQRVPLDASYPDSSEVLAMFKQYQEELERSGLAGLGIQPEAHASGYQFVGSQACADCHQEAYDVWEQSGHAHATQSLVAPHGRADIPRQFDPECLSCHTTGWQPQKFIPYESGFTSLADTLRLQGNGCENCHGPGSEHVRLESDSDSTEEALSKLRQFVQIKKADAQTSCLECHDPDNSPDFHHDGAFEEYWEKISH